MLEKLYERVEKIVRKWWVSPRHTLYIMSTIELAKTVTSTNLYGNSYDNWNMQLKIVRSKNGEVVNDKRLCVHCIIVQRLYTIYDVYTISISIAYSWLVYVYRSDWRLLTLRWYTHPSSVYNIRVSARRKCPLDANTKHKEAFIITNIIVKYSR